MGLRPQAASQASLGGLPGIPPRWVSNCSRVTFAYRAFILPLSSGKTSPMVVSQRSLPSSMRVAASVAVMDLVQEPMWNRSLLLTSVESPALRTPAAARSQISPFLATTIASDSGQARDDARLKQIVEPALAADEGLDQAIARQFGDRRCDPLELPPPPTGPMRLVDGRRLEG